MSKAPGAVDTLEVVADKQSITDLCSRYALALDARDWQSLRDLFTSDAVVDFAHVGEVHGSAAVVETCSAALVPLDGSQHLIGTVLVTIEGDHARSYSYFQAQHIRGTRTLLVGGSYEDELVRNGPGWLISRRVQKVSWTSGDAATLSM
jgi:hypothetical protein